VTAVPGPSLRWSQASSDEWALSDRHRGTVLAAVTRLGPYPEDGRLAYRVSGPAVAEPVELPTIVRALARAEELAATGLCGNWFV
jgi:hypothetical protein